MNQNPNETETETKTEETRYPIRRTATRIRGGRFVTLKVELSGDSDKPRLSICGTSGRVVRRPQARKDALAYWRGFFEDSPEELAAMNERCGTRFRSATSAARYVLDSDGEFHGLGVSQDRGTTVLVGDSWGQIQEELAEFFPEVKPWLPYHLNDMKAGCEHQDALGWGHGRTVALDAASATPAQLEALKGLAEAQAARENAKSLRDIWEMFDRNPQSHASLPILRDALERAPSIHDAEVAAALGHYEIRKAPIPYSLASDARALALKIASKGAAKNPPKAFEAAIYKDSIGAPCPTCGYRYGSAWTYRPLPDGVRAWVESVPSLSSKP